MKQKYQSLSLLALIALTAATTPAAFAKGTAMPDPGRYAIDPAHSKVGFEIPHLVISSVEGRFVTFDGNVEIGKTLAESKISANVQTASIDTANAKRDEHLKSADFFDTTKHPTMTFKSGQLTGTPAAFKMTGNLTIRGVSQPVVFDGRYLGSVKDAWGNEKAAFVASTKINRKDFGLTWNKLIEAGPTVGDEVTLSLKIQAAKTKPE